MADKPGRVRRITTREVERLRLILSTYQDGSGMLRLSDGATLPGWRDFERSVAVALSGEAQESKAIFDVLLPTRAHTLKHGVSCKMRRELNRLARDGRVVIELSNSSGKFWDYLGGRRIHQRNYRKHPDEVGRALIELVGDWHKQVSLAQGGSIELSGSFYLTLSWSRTGDYQLHQFPILLPDASKLHWHFPQPKVIRSPKSTGRRLSGNDASGTLFEWYGESGGQLKYYPPASSALWSSKIFRLEALPNIEHGAIAKVSAYFPELWAQVNQ